jgi:hypothetical protein
VCLVVRTLCGLKPLLAFWNTLSFVSYISFPLVLVIRLNDNRDELSDGTNVLQDMMSHAQCIISRATERSDCRSVTDDQKTNVSSKRGERPAQRQRQV